MSASRTAILERIRASLKDVPSSETAADRPIVRDYLTIDPSDHEEKMARFVERVTEYRAKVHRIAASELGPAIASACKRRGIQRLVVPRDIPESWLPADTEILRDELLTNEQLNNSDGVLSGCALGIAQTGTIILDRGRNQGRRALTLLPDYHLCVVFENQVVGIVPEGVKALRAVAGDPSRPLTWISGPSATSDIELNRVEGVHGPRTLEVLVVSDHP
jgi:L-lactate dehydrogenase complex protein LldG